jgi:hypothetical protein
LIIDESYRVATESTLGHHNDNQTALNLNSITLKGSPTSSEIDELVNDVIENMSPINDWFVAPFSHHTYNHQNQYQYLQQQQHQDNQATVFTNYYPTIQYSIEPPPTANNPYNVYLECSPDIIKQEPMSVVSRPLPDSFYAAVDSSSSTQPLTSYPHEQVLMLPNKIRRKYNSRRQFGKFSRLLIT